MGVLWTAAMVTVPNVILNFFMNPTPSVMEIAPGILRTYGISYILLPFNIFATYYFQAMMKPNLSAIASFARGAAVSGVMIIMIPLLFGADRLWFSMLITEILVALFSIYYIIQILNKNTETSI